MIEPRRPAVTIAIAAYNCAATLGEAIDSCLAQSCPDVEVLVVDDGSTDSTPDVIAGYGACIRAVRQSNGGLASARNAGMRAARGEFVAWMDGDDICVPDRLSIQAAVLRAFPSVVLVSSNFTVFGLPGCDENALALSSYFGAPRRLGGLSRIYPHADELRLPGTGLGEPVRVLRGDVHLALLDGSFVHPPTVMLRRAVLEQVGYCDTSLRYSPDYEFAVRASRVGELAFVEAPLLRYRISERKMSMASEDGTMQLETVAIMDRYRQLEPQIDPRLFDRHSARAYLAAAGEIGGTDRARSIALLRRGIGRGASLTDASRVLARVLMPPAARPAVRWIRRTFVRA